MYIHQIPETPTKVSYEYSRVVNALGDFTAGYRFPHAEFTYRVLNSTGKITKSIRQVLPQGAKSVAITQDCYSLSKPTG